MRVHVCIPVCVGEREVNMIAWVRAVVQCVCKLLLVLLTFSAGDASAASQLSEQEVNERVQLYVDIEDPYIVLDLQSLNSGQKSKYDAFWDEVQKFLQEGVGLAVEERRHSQVTHLARVIIVTDL